MNKKTMKLTPAKFRAAFEADSLNEAERSVEIVWTTGYKGLRSSYDGSYYEELSLEPGDVNMVRLQNGAPLLAAHSSDTLDDVIGVVERAWIEGGVGKAVVRFAEDAASDRAYQKVKSKILRNISVGYSIEQYTDVSKPTDEIPTLRATKWTPHEISVVPIGFDPAAQVRSADNTNETEVEVITLSTTETNKETEMSERNDEVSTSAVTETPEIVVVEEQTPATVEEVAVVAPTVDAETIEMEVAARASEIINQVRTAGLDLDVASELIAARVSVEEANKRIFQKHAERKQKEAVNVTNKVSVEITVDERDKKRSGIEAALLSRIDSRNFQVTDEARAFAGKSFLRQLEDLMGRNMGESDMALAKRAMASADLPLLLANVAEKSLQKQYQLAPASYKSWAKTDTLRNYKEHSQVQLGDFASLIERAENANYTEATTGEKRETVQIKDFGIVHSFSSQMLVNDDLNAISRLATQGGVAASRLENKLAYAALTTNKVMADGLALYSAGHGNLGTGGAISETTVGEAYKMMRKQTSVSGLDTLNLTPQFLICGPEQEVAARKFLAQIAPTATGDVNVFAGSMQLIVDAEIATDDYYFAANPSVIDTVVLYKLEGAENPTVETRFDWDNDALQIKCKHAVGAAPMDTRGLVRNNGSVA